MKELNRFCVRCGMSEKKFQGKSSTKRGILCDFEFSNGAHSFDVEANIPSGVSGWEQYGKKYGYWDFFKEKIKSTN